MSITFEAENGTRFHHNSDLSGNVTIVTKEGTLAVPGDDLVEFWMENVRVNLIEAVEQLDLKKLVKR